MMLNRIDPDVLARAAADPGFLAMYDAALRALDAARAPAATGWWHTHSGARSPAGDRVLLRGVRAAPVAADLRRRSRRARGRSLQGSQRPRACRSSASGSCTRRATSVSASRTTAGSRRSTNSSTGPMRRSRTRERSTTSRASCSCRWGRGRFSCRSGKSGWRRVRLLLLDTNLEQNTPEDRALSARLYGGGQDIRLQQEIVLGLGGVLTLRALGLSPAVWHLNEGHAAFVVLQRLRDLLASGTAWDDALAEVRRTTVFTTHTPVPAGHDAFPFDLVEQHLAGTWGSMNGHGDRFRQLGQYDSGTGPQLQHDGARHAVVRRHQRGEPAPRQGDAGNVRAALARDAGRATATSTRSRTACTCQRGSRAIWRALFERHLSPAWRDQYEDPAFWSRILEIPDEDLWAARESLRAALFQFIRERARQRWTDERVGASRAWSSFGAMLDPTRADHRVRAAVHRLQAARPACSATAIGLRGSSAAPAGPCSSCSPARRIRPTSPASTSCSASSRKRSIPGSAAASPSWTTTICTSRTCSCRAATSGSTRRASHSKRAARAA